MRSAIILLNAFIVIFFGVFFAYTFVAQEHIEQLAIKYAIEKTTEYADPLTEEARQLLQNQSAQKFLPKKEKELLMNELDAYKADSSSYILSLSQKNNHDEPKSKWFSKVISWQKPITDYLQETLDLLLRDLRIFSGSNFIAGSIALYLAFRSPPKVRRLLVWLSFLMFVAVCYSSYVYIDDLSFFKILMRIHIGWFYPILLSLTIIRYFRDYGNNSHTADEIDELLKPTQLKSKNQP